MFEKLKNAINKISALTLIFFIVTGCGEQTVNEASEEILNSHTGDTMQNFGSVVLSGKAIKGVINNANVSVYLIKNGEITNDMLASARTDINGEFSVKIPRKHARRLLYLELTASNSELSPSIMTCDAFSGCGQINGKNIAFGDTFPLNSNFILRNVVKLEGHEDFLPAHFSPLRHMVVAQVEAAENGFTWSNLDAAGNQVAESFSLQVPIHKLTPIDLTADAETLYLASDDEIIAAIIDASFLNIGEFPNYKPVEEVLNNLSQQNGSLEEGRESISMSEIMLTAGSNIPTTLKQRNSVTHYFGIEGDNSTENEGDNIPVQYSLKLGIRGNGGVNNSDNSIVCNTSLCTYEFSEEASLSLVATPAQGYEFERWEGACSESTSDKCILNINTGSDVTAIFKEAVIIEPTYYSLTIGTSGAGIVSNSENNINCSETSCRTILKEGSKLALSALPSEGYEFDHWELQCIGSTSPNCALSMNNDLSIIAVFKQKEIYFSLNMLVVGNGTVQNLSNNITCNSGTCSKELLQGTNLTLMATAAEGYEFDHWELSCDNSSLSECKLAMQSDITVKAVFTESVAQLGFINVNWSAPTEREDGTALAASEIKQYTIYYRESQDQPYSGAASMIVTDNGSGNVPTSLKIEGLEKGKSYYLAGVTIDSNGLTSKLSNEIIKAVQ